MDAVIRKQHNAHCEVLTDSGQNLQDSSGTMTRNQELLHSAALKDIGQTLQDKIGRSDTEPTDGTV